MIIEENEYAIACKKLNDYRKTNKWSYEEYQTWLENHKDINTFIKDVKKLIGEL